METQRIHPLLLLQQPVYSFEAERGDHNGATRNELLSDQVPDLILSIDMRCDVQYTHKDGRCLRSKADAPAAHAML